MEFYNNLHPEAFSDRNLYQGRSKGEGKEKDTISSAGLVHAECTRVAIRLASYLPSPISFGFAAALKALLSSLQ